MTKILNYGMVGGGKGSFIGDTHRRAIVIDSKAKLVSGCFSRDYENTLETGESLGVEKDRLYKDYNEMAKKESAMADGIDFVVIVTPNNSHFDACKAFLNAGIHVACDKPLTLDLDQALELQRLSEEKNLQFLVTYTYAGYTTVKNIRNMVADGQVGDIRNIVAEYPQSWLAFRDGELSKQGKWRSDPNLSGKTNCLGDIGTHIENMVSTMTGLKVKRVLAKMQVIVEGRKLDDNSTIMVEYENGVSGLYWCSQIAVGHDNGLHVRIFGSEGGLSWRQEESEKFNYTKIGESTIELHRGHKSLCDGTEKYERLPLGHSEGMFGAMANLYSSFIDCVSMQITGEDFESHIDYPTVVDGVNGIKFVEACIKSSNNGNVWVEV